MDCIIKEIKIEEINSIRPLWEKLNKIHLDDSTYFKEHYQSFTFEKRCKSFLEMDPAYVKIKAFENSQGTVVGYCIATAVNGTGEIESLFVDDNYRKQGLGKKLVEHTLAWLKANHCVTIGVSVAEGHESVFDFYKQFGFYPRRIYLQMK